MSRITSIVERTKNDRTERARRIVLAKGVFDMLLSLSIVFVPILIYDGPLQALVSKLTGLQFIYRDADPGAAYALASLIMGAAFAAISAGMSDQDDAYKVVATLNGAFAYTGLLGCLFSPKRFGSAPLLLMSLQDVIWFFVITKAGGYGFADTLGFGAVADRLKKDVEKHIEERTGDDSGKKEKITERLTERQ